MAAGQVNVEALGATVYGDSPSVDIHGNSQGAQYVVQSLPSNSTMSAQGNVYVAGTATAVAPVAVIPTTASHLTLWNGESQTSGSGRSYIILSVGYYTVVSAGAALITQMLVNVSTVPTTVPSGTAATSIVGLSGLSTGTSATIKSAVTITNNGVWHPFGPSYNAAAATATVGLGGETYTQGEYILRPGGLFNMAVLCSAAASATCSIFVKWAELPLKLGR